MVHIVETYITSVQLFSHHLPDVLRCSKSVFLLSAVEIYRRIDLYQAEPNTQSSGLCLFWNDTECIRGYVVASAYWPCVCIDHQFDFGPPRAQAHLYEPDS